MRLNRTIFASIFALLLNWAGPVGATVIDDFTSGNDFNITKAVGQVEWVNYTGSGPIGNQRQVRITGGAHTGNNTTVLDTTAGTLSTSILGYADTFVSYGTGIVGGPELNIAATDSSVFEFDFSDFDLGVSDIGGYFSVGFRDGNGSIFSRYMTVAEMTSLDVSGGGMASMLLNSFTNFGSYNGEIDGIWFGVDDRDFDLVVISEVRLSAVQAPAPASGLLVALGLFALIRRRR